MTRGEHGRASRLVVAALFAATVLTLAGCSGRGGHMGYEVVEQCQNASEVWYKTAAKDVAEEVVKTCADAAPDVVGNALETDSDGDRIPNVYDDYPYDPGYY